MARRALDFANAHPVADTSFAAVVTRLNDAVTRADTLGMQLSDGQINERAARTQRRTLKRNIGSQQLRRLVRIAAVAVQTHPELAGMFVLPSRDLPNQDFLLAGRSLLAAATASKEILVPLGLGQTFIDDLTAALDQFDTATQTAHTGRSNHVGARADLAGIARACKNDVIVLDTYYHEVFPNDLDLLAAWASARNIAGPFRHTSLAPAPVPPAPAPATADTADTAKVA